MTVHITDYRAGFPPGLTRITNHENDEDGMPISLGVLKLSAGECHQSTPGVETAYLLMNGTVRGTVAGEEFQFNRASLFDEAPSCLHVSAGTPVRIDCDSDVEFTVYSCDNTAAFNACIYHPGDVEDEPRGKGQVEDRCLRYVRTIFDRRNAPEAAQLVLGEVITFQGGWSSYPPHHHPQPEIYHYRFTEPQGYGHGELGETVLKVRHGDTVKIMELNDHAQCAAPGYGMYYSWVIRHLPDLPYTVPEFTDEHSWIMQPDSDFWRPKN